MWYVYLLELCNGEISRRLDSWSSLPPPGFGWQATPLRAGLLRGILSPALPRYLFAACLMFGAFTCGAVAQTNPVERDVNALSGRDVRVGVYTSIRPDCTSGPLPAIRLAVAPAHGTVSVKRATLKATNIKECLAIDVPAFVAFYRATQNYTGTDDFELDVTFAAGRKELQHIRVHVGNGAGGGLGI